MRHESSKNIVLGLYDAVNEISSGLRLLIARSSSQNGDRQCHI